MKVQDAVVEEDEDDCIRVLLENHGFSPVVVEEGQILGSMEEVRLCQEESLVDEAVVSAVLPGEFSAERLEQLRDSLKLDPQLTEEQVQQMRDLVLEFADVFALDSTELGSTDLVTHHIDTGDSRPIKQPPRRIPFALRQTVEEMVHGNNASAGGSKAITQPMVQSGGVGGEEGWDQTLLCGLPTLECGYKARRFPIAPY